MDNMAWHGRGGEGRRGLQYTAIKYSRRCNGILVIVKLFGLSWHTCSDRVLALKKKGYH